MKVGVISHPRRTAKVLMWSHNGTWELMEVTQNLQHRINKSCGLLLLRCHLYRRLCNSGFVFYQDTSGTTRCKIDQAHFE